ncbi:hypothetical protein, partial [Treponema sp. R80B11-R83G3]
MKKRVVFFVLLLLGLVFFACEFNIPKAIEIKGSPSVRFVQTIDIGEKFTDLINKAIKGDDGEGAEGVEGMDIVPCTNTGLTNVTFLIHMDLFEKTLTIEEDSPEDLAEQFPGIDLDLIDELTENDTITLEEDRNLLASPEPMTLPLSSI